MKKILIGIFSIILGFVGFGFCSPFVSTITDIMVSPQDTFNFYGSCIGGSNQSCINRLVDSNGNFLVPEQESLELISSINLICGINSGTVLKNNNTSSTCVYYFYDFSDGGSSSCEDKDITVYYNSGSSESITCDGVQAIEIKGLSSLTSSNTFTPYFNISYRDEDNQSLIESYSKNILYLENGQFKKTYTGNNDWILTVQGGSENSFSGYLPTFEITGGIEEVSSSGNIFNNFAENSVKFTLSNIPSYIQYVILLFILFFILGFIRKFRRK